MKKLFLFITLVFVNLQANTIAVNSSIVALDKYSYETPQGRPMKVPHETQIILIAFEKDTGAIVNNFLNAQNKYYLQKNKTIFIADIHRMPSLITKMFALPKMRKYKHLIYLQYGKEFENVIPHKEEKITVMHLAHGTIMNVSYVSNAKELKASIER